MSMQHTSVRETSLSRDQVLERVRQIIAESAGVSVEEVGEKQPLLRDLPWDSLDQVECVMEIEEEYDISVSDDLVDQAKTAGDITDGVMQLLGQTLPSDVSVRG
jgi:acyl carrier protein